MGCSSSKNIEGGNTDKVPVVASEFCRCGSVATPNTSPTHTTLSHECETCSTIQNYRGPPSHHYYSSSSPSACMAAPKPSGGASHPQSLPDTNIRTTVYEEIEHFHQNDRIAVQRRTMESIVGGTQLPQHPPPLAISNHPLQTPAPLHAPNGGIWECSSKDAAPGIREGAEEVFEMGVGARAGTEGV